MKSRNVTTSATDAIAGSGTAATKGARRGRKADYGQFTNEEITSRVCGLFCEGRKVSEIVDEIGEKLGVTLSREEPYRIVASAANNGRLHFQPLSGRDLAERMERAYGWLRYVEVVHTTRSDDVAEAAAERLLHLCTSLPRREDSLHIGLAGGTVMFKMVRCFARLLAQRPENLPHTLVFHSL